MEAGESKTSKNPKQKKSTSKNEDKSQENDQVDMLREMKAGESKTSETPK